MRINGVMCTGDGSAESMLVACLDFLCRKKKKRKKEGKLNVFTVLKMKCDYFIGGILTNFNVSLHPLQILLCLPYIFLLALVRACYIL